MHKVTENPQFLPGSFSLYYVFLLYLSFIPGFLEEIQGYREKARHENHQETFARPVISVPDSGLDSDGRVTIGKLERSLDTRKYKIQEAAGEVEIASA